MNHLLKYNLLGWRAFLLATILSACQAAPTPTQAIPTAVNCNPGYHSRWPQPVYLTGSVTAGPVVDATVRLYVLEAGGKLSPVALDRPMCTGSDGSYQTPALPKELDGKTLVIEASGGSFVDEATGQTVSFTGHSLYSVIPVAEFGYPLGGVVTPFTDLAFRLTRHDLSADPSLSPSNQASYNNFWIVRGFHLGETEGAPTKLEKMQPTNLFDGKPHPADNVDTYALALAGLSQQAADASISPVDWIAQLSADADDGNLDGAAKSSAISLQAAIDKFLAGPRNPLPFKSMPTSGPPIP